MNGHQALDFEAMPPWRVPFGFFLIAPLFGVLAGLCLLFMMPIFQSRWQSEYIALLHLLTIGVIFQIIVGALFQVIPVLTGHKLTESTRLPRCVQGLLILGVVGMFSGLYFDLPVLGGLGWIALFIFGILLLFLLTKIAWLNPDNNRPQKGFRLVSVALAATLLSGLGLLWMHVWPETLWMDRRWTDIHLTIAVSGFMGLLIMTVSFHVIPMFHVTDEFDGSTQRYLPIAVCLSLAFFTVVKFLFPFDFVTEGAKWLLLGLYGGFAILVWLKLKSRKRKTKDSTVMSWQLAVILYGVFLVLSASKDLNLLTGIEPQQWSWMLSLLLIYGVLFTVIIGMLQKIIPFLGFLHLQKMCGSDFQKIRALPKTHALLSPLSSRRLVYFHGLTTIVLVSAVLVGEWQTKLSAILVILEFVWLVTQLKKVVGHLRRVEMAEEQEKA